MVERRKYHLDRSINVGNIVTVVVLLIGLFGYIRGIYDSTKDIQFKVNMMWADYLTTHNVK